MLLLLSTKGKVFITFLEIRVHLYKDHTKTLNADISKLEDHQRDESLEVILIFLRYRNFIEKVSTPIQVLF